MVKGIDKINLLNDRKVLLYMFSINKSRKTIHLIIDDHSIRIVETNGDNIFAVRLFGERIVPKDLIRHGKIIDEIGFYEYMKDLVKELKIRNRQVRFNVPSSLVIMRQVEVPSHLQEKKEILDYIDNELGKSIHLPFEDPIIDIPTVAPIDSEAENEAREITFFAAPGEELRKYTEVFVDVSLRPQAVDVGILSSYRYFHHTQTVAENRIYLLVEFNASSTHLGIFNRGNIEFLRYQDLDIHLKGQYDEELQEISWEYEEDENYAKGIMMDQVSELDRIMNFYRFSLHRGDKVVTDIVLFGDNPYLEDVYQEMKNRFEDVQVLLLPNHFNERTNDTISRAYIPALGLALRGGK